METKKISLICNALFALESKNGHLKWTVAELARKCKVSKSLVYYYFGKNKLEIFNKSFELICREVYGLTPEREALLRRGRIVDSMVAIHEYYQTCPQFSSFYFYHRSSNSAIGKRLEAYDELYIERLLRLFPKLKRIQAIALMGMLHGLVISPWGERSVYETAIDWLAPQLK